MYVNWLEWFRRCSNAIVVQISDKVVWPALLLSDLHGSSLDEHYMKSSATLHALCNYRTRGKTLYLEGVGVYDIKSFLGCCQLLVLFSFRKDSSSLPVVFGHHLRWLFIVFFVQICIQDTDSLESIFSC